MKKLILIAHPSKSSTSHKIAEIYKLKSEQAGDQTQMHDLYKTDKQLWFLDFDIKQKNLKYREDQVLWADELVFILPLWHTGRPAILKNRFDNVFHSWFAYKYENWRPHGLLSPRTAQIFLTCGWPSFIYKVFPLRLKLIRRVFRLWFTWVKLKRITFIDRINNRKKSPSFQIRLKDKVKV